MIRGSGQKFTHKKPRVEWDCPSACLSTLLMSTSCPPYEWQVLLLPPSALLPSCPPPAVCLPAHPAACLPVHVTPACCLLLTTACYCRYCRCCRSGRQGQCRGGRYGRTADATPVPDGECAYMSCHVTCGGPSRVNHPHRAAAAAAMSSLRRLMTGDR